MSEKNYNPNEEAETITLEFEGGENVECAPVCVFESEKQEYIALIPVDCEEEVYIYRFFEEEDGSAVIENIEDDDEYEKAADAFDAWVDAEDEQ